MKVEYMKTVYFVRHAQSEANIGSISQPEREIALSNTGLQQAQALVACLPVAKNVFVSEMQRTQQTAAPYCQQHNLTAQVLPVLNEFSCLAFDTIRDMDGEARRPLAQAYWQRADPQECTGSGADRFVDFNQRIDDFVQHWHHLPDGSVLFGHGIWLGLLLWKLWGFQAESSADMRAFRAWQSQLPMSNTAIWQLNGSLNQPLFAHYLGNALNHQNGS